MWVRLARGIIAAYVIAAVATYVVVSPDDLPTHVIWASCLAVPLFALAAWHSYVLRRAGDLEEERAWKALPADMAWSIELFTSLLIFPPLAFVLSVLALRFAPARVHREAMLVLRLSVAFMVVLALVLVAERG